MNKTKAIILATAALLSISAQAYDSNNEKLVIASSVPSVNIAEPQINITDVELNNVQPPVNTQISITNNGTILSAKILNETSLNGKHAAFICLKGKLYFSYNGGLVNITDEYCQ